jgi:hypothetical protein
MSILAPECDFETEDGFLHALVGLLAMDTEIRTVLAHEVDAGPEGAAVTDDPILYAALGLIRLSAQLRTAAESWMTSDDPPPAPPEPTAFFLPEILR